MARAQPFDSRTGPCICRLEPSWWVRFHLSATRASNYIDAYTGAAAVNGRVHRRQHLWVLPPAEIVVGAPHRHLAAAVTTMVHRLRELPGRPRSPRAIVIESCGVAA